MSSSARRSLLSSLLHSATATAEPPAGVDAASTFAVSGWDLSALLPSADEATVSARLAIIETLVADLEAQRPVLAPDMAPGLLLEILRRFEKVLIELDVIGGYANLRFSADTQSSEAVAFRNRIRGLLAACHNRFLFLELWWKGLDDDQARQLEPQGEAHADYRQFLSELRRFKPYTLDESAEKVINLKNPNGIDAVLTLYQMITNRMEFRMTVAGEEKVMTDGEMRSLFFSADPELRARVYPTLYAGYDQEATVLAQIYATRVRDWYTEYVELRGLPSPISVRNLSNDVSDQAVDTMLATVHRNTGVFQDYFKLKAKWLGLAPFRRYDLYAPLTSSNESLPFHEAVASVVSTFERFDPRFGAMVERLFRERRVDSEIRKGKRSGAFCATVVPQYAPWVLVNYTGRFRDVATLAHEFGHAIHSLLAADHSVLTQQPPLPLAETASVFCEMLMTDRLLAETRDPIARRDLLASAVDDIYATVMRQAYFVRFEIEAHKAIIANKSAEDLFTLYEANLREQFGDSMEIGPEFRSEWLCIPHLFNTPFYCYAYSFGQLLVLALYRRYQREGDAFIPGYIRLLSYGGSKSPAEALGELGIDIADPNFWEGGFDVVRDLIAELESLEIPQTA